MEASAPLKLTPVAVTVLAAPTVLLAKLPVPPVRLTVSLPCTPVNERPVIVAAVVPSYILSAAETRAVTVAVVMFAVVLAVVLNV